MVLKGLSKRSALPVASRSSSRSTSPTSSVTSGASSGIPVPTRGASAGRSAERRPSGAGAALSTGSAGSLTSSTSAASTATASSTGASAGAGARNKNNNATMLDKLKFFKGSSSGGGKGSKQPAGSAPPPDTPATVGGSRGSSMEPASHRERGHHSSTSGRSRSSGTTPQVRQRAEAQRAAAHQGSSTSMDSSDAGSHYNGNHLYPSPRQQQANGNSGQPPAPQGVLHLQNSHFIPPPPRTTSKSSTPRDSLKSRSASGQRSSSQSGARVARSGSSSGVPPPQTASPGASSGIPKPGSNGRRTAERPKGIPLASAGSPAHRGHYAATGGHNQPPTVTVPSPSSAYPPMGAEQPPAPPPHNSRHHGGRSSSSSRRHEAAAPGGGGGGGGEGEPVMAAVPYPRGISAPAVQKASVGTQSSKHDRRTTSSSSHHSTGAPTPPTRQESKPDHQIHKALPTPPNLPDPPPSKQSKADQLQQQQLKAQQQQKLHQQQQIQNYKHDIEKHNQQQQQLQDKKEKEKTEQALDEQSLAGIKPMAPLGGSGAARNQYNYLKLFNSTRNSYQQVASRNARLQGVSRVLYDPSASMSSSTRSSDGASANNGYHSDAETFDASGYMSDGDALRTSGYLSDYSGYMSESGISAYTKKIQQRFREGMQAVQESMKKSSGGLDSDSFDDDASSVSSGDISDAVAELAADDSLQQDDMHGRQAKTSAAGGMQLRDNPLSRTRIGRNLGMDGHHQQLQQTNQAALASGIAHYSTLRKYASDVEADYDQESDCGSLDRSFSGAGPECYFSDTESMSAANLAAGFGAQRKNSANAGAQGLQRHPGARVSGLSLQNRNALGRASLGSRILQQHSIQGMPLHRMHRTQPPPPPAGDPGVRSGAGPAPAPLEELARAHSRSLSVPAVQRQRLSQDGSLPQSPRHTGAATAQQISPTSSLSSIKLPYATPVRASASNGSLAEFEDVKGSSLSLSSTTSCMSANEEKQASEIRKLRRELENAQEKVLTLTSQLSTNVNAVNAVKLVPLHCDTLDIMDPWSWSHQSQERAAPRNPRIDRFYPNFYSNTREYEPLDPKLKRRSLLVDEELLSSKSSSASVSPRSPQPPHIHPELEEDEEEEDEEDAVQRMCLSPGVQHRRFRSLPFTDWASRTGSLRLPRRQNSNKRTTSVSTATASHCQAAPSSAMSSSMYNSTHGYCCPQSHSQVA